MYRGFQVKDLSFKEYPDLIRLEGEKIYESCRNNWKSTLSKFVDQDGAVDGTKIQKEWFPQGEYDVFISHSHKDFAIAKFFAGWLAKNFNLKVFLDSCAWKYSNDLLLQIDGNYSKNTSGQLDYEKLLCSSSHVHMMLSVALLTMMDSTECLFFINTPNSLSHKDVVDKTLSPWLYLELASSRFLRMNLCRPAVVEKAGIMENKNLSVKYDVNIKNLVKLDQKDLLGWQAKSGSQKGKKALDILYETHPSAQEAETKYWSKYL